MQYLDNHMLPGYAAVEAGQVTGYSSASMKRPRRSSAICLRCPAHAPMKARVAKLRLVESGSRTNGT
jgi:hypothetical protein